MDDIDEVISDNEAISDNEDIDKKIDEYDEGDDNDLPKLGINKDINDEDIIRINNKLNIRFILQKMNSCKSFNRFETILNINKEPSLTSLHYSFKPTEDYLSI